MNNTVISEGFGFRVMPLGYNVKVSEILGIAGEYRDIMVAADSDGFSDLVGVHAAVMKLRDRLRSIKDKKVRACEPLGAGLPG